MVNPDVLPGFFPHISVEISEMPKGAETELMDKWKVQDAVEMYGENE